MTDKSVQGLHGKIFYKEYGNGLTLLMLHGFGINSDDIWFKMLPILSRKYKIITLDLAGYGENEKYLSTYTLSDQAQYLSAFIESKKNIDYILGYSYGGRILYEYIQNINTNTKKIIIAGTSFFETTSFIYYFFFLMSFFNFSAKATIFALTQSPVRELVVYIFGLTKISNKDLLSYTTNKLRGQSNSKAILRGLSYLFTKSNLKKPIKYAVNLMYGEKDKLAKVTMSRNINHNRISIVKDAYHLMPLEKPEEMANEIIKFIGE